MGHRVLGISWELFIMDVYEAHGLVEMSRPYIRLVWVIGMQRRHEEVAHTPLASVFDGSLNKCPAYTSSMASRIDTIQQTSALCLP